MGSTIMNSMIVHATDREHDRERAEMKSAITNSRIMNDAIMNNTIIGSAAMNSTIMNSTIMNSTIVHGAAIAIATVAADLFVDGLLLVGVGPALALHRPLVRLLPEHGRVVGALRRPQHQTVTTRATFASAPPHL